jgi:hypothetical protein
VAWHISRNQFSRAQAQRLCGRWTSELFVPRTSTSETTCVPAKMLSGWCDISSLKISRTARGKRAGRISVLWTVNQSLKPWHQSFRECLPEQTNGTEKNSHYKMLTAARQYTGMT